MTHQDSLADFSPVNLSYVAALRGARPRNPGTGFTYAVAGCSDLPNLICLAASNPEGQFFGIVNDPSTAEGAARLAASRGVKNVSFLSGKNAQLAAAAEGSSSGLPMLDYLVCDMFSQSSPQQDEERAGLFDLAAKKLRPNGLLAYRYRAYRGVSDILKFLISEFSPEMDVPQSMEFLADIKNLSPAFFEGNPDAAVELERAMAGNAPDEFFGCYDAGGTAFSGTFATMEGLLPRGFAFAGDACVGANYMELATPPSAHAVLQNCREHLMYEPIKDFAMQRVVRNDVWCRLPAERTEDLASLFGGFTYGTTAPLNQIPSEICGAGKTIDITLSPFKEMLSLMEMMPINIGDYLEHESGKGVEPQDAVAAMQILVAGGVVRPMRSSYPGKSGDISQPRWSEKFNGYLNDEPIESPRVVLASSVVGSGVSVSAREALVMQALNRGGMADSPSKLLPELIRLSEDPSLCSQIIDAAEPNEEIAVNMIKETVGNSMMRWCAYGLIAA